MRRHLRSPASNSAVPGGLDCLIEATAEVAAAAASAAFAVVAGEAGIV